VSRVRLTRYETAWQSTPVSLSELYAHDEAASAVGDDWAPAR